MPHALQEYLKARQQQVDARLGAVLDLSRGIPPALLDAMKYSLLAPGKRLRPILVLMACQACGGREEDAFPAACAVEMVHTYSLIHDDLPAMDDDDLRRGRPTCHRKFGEALAILAGDGLLTLAFEVLVDGYPAAVAAGCCRELARGAGAAGMVGGQVEDLAWENVTGRRHDPFQPEGSSNPSLDALERIHSNKTGALFRACLRMGAWTALDPGARDPAAESLDMLDRFGRCFGLLFQITDDLIDVEGNAQDTGKRTQKDAGRGKLTYPGLLGVEASRQRARDLHEQARRALEPLGAGGDLLLALSGFVLARDR